MATIFHVMKEEYERLQAAERLYRAKIDELPKGKPRIKRIHGIEYLYLNRREGKKVVDEYVGRADSPKALECLALVEKRDRFIQLRKETKKQLAEVQKVLRGKV